MTTTTDRPRTGKPYIWPTWITKLLSGEHKCWWAAWFRSHYKYAKRDDGSDFDRDQWTKTHDAMVDAWAEELDKRGWLCGIEDDNKFDLEGKVAILGGKPDIIAKRYDEKRVTIVDAKSGRQRDSDQWQVKIYLFALPKHEPELIDWKMNGMVLYRNNGTINVPLTVSESLNIVEAIKVVGGPDAPARSPSVGECRFCDIASCPDRAKPRSTDVSHLF